jgi:hypothetical protein
MPGNQRASVPVPVPPPQRLRISDDLEALRSLGTESMNPDIFKIEPVTEENIDVLEYMENITFDLTLAPGAAERIIAGRRHFAFLVKIEDRYVGK